MLHPVILCGGSGSRLWPLSRSQYPKQFLSVCGERSLLQSTVQRSAGLPDRGGVIAVCNQEHRFLVAQQLREAGAEALTVVLEPVGRNTAPAVAVAAMQALSQDPEATLLVMPSDHLVGDDGAFHQAVGYGVGAAAQGRLVTFGISPDRAETGYGYIRADGGREGPVRPVREFIEKPDRDTAESYLASGEYYWNSGLFLFGARTYLDALQRYRRDIFDACDRAFGRVSADMDFVRLQGEAFAACPAESIDCAVMEKTRDAAVVPMDCGWSDVGDWSTLHEVTMTDETGNVLLGDVLVEDTEGSYVRAEGRLVAAVGVENQVIVETPDAVLVAARDRAQDVKHIVERLRAEGRHESNVHRRVYRPWGSYEGISQADRFQVKRIVVDPGQRLSLQMHHHRAEHWVVVRGTARVTRGDDEFLLSEDQSTYIPLGVRHRLENAGVIPLEVIEVQTGSYLGEDDIVRFDDVYGRVPTDAKGAPAEAANEGSGISEAER